MEKDFQKMFEEGLAKSGTGYDEQIKGYEQSQAAETAALETQRANQEKKLQAERQGSHQDAYVSKRMAEKNMPQLLAAQGITGGMAETTASNVFNDYLKSKTKADGIYSSANSELQNSFMTNNANLQTKYAQLLSEARQKQRDDAFAKMQWAYQAKNEEEDRAEKKKQQEIEAWAKASKGGSGGSAGRHSIAQIQQLLNNMGYNLSVDNKWGPNTATAVRHFQIKNGLSMDGIVGSNTWAALNR
ncbi:MAG: peptidoglycan-binding domain-containing protein [Christensenella sp.]|uniref:peptidoglycan-binding domain-containing protein n=1 Tax=Christensenella sp. TaxID=1935934 RepID=UPI002B21B09D|nr:peptidoglycan-binding domain-containing protein [Christensenella sp.]MEA5002411.1 peptidoglycan-binding domain-containing protein [Christensenella sp.]